VGWYTLKTQVRTDIQRDVVVDVLGNESSSIRNEMVDTFHANSDEQAVAIAKLLLKRHASDCRVDPGLSVCCKLTRLEPVLWSDVLTSGSEFVAFSHEHGYNFPDAFRAWISLPEQRARLEKLLIECDGLLRPHDVQLSSDDLIEVLGSVYCVDKWRSKEFEYRPCRMLSEADSRQLESRLARAFTECGFTLIIDPENTIAMMGMLRALMGNGVVFFNDRD
jgi:hypothetical protein